MFRFESATDSLFPASVRRGLLSAFVLTPFLLGAVLTGPVPAQEEGPAAPKQAADEDPPKGGPRPAEPPKADKPAQKEAKPDPGKKPADDPRKAGPRPAEPPKADKPAAPKQNDPTPAKTKPKQPAWVPLVTRTYPRPADALTCAAGGVTARADP